MGIVMERVYAGFAGFGVRGKGTQRFHVAVRRVFIFCSLFVLNKVMRLSVDLM